METNGNEFVARRAFPLAIRSGRNGALFWYAAQPEYRKENMRKSEGVDKK